MRDRIDVAFDFRSDTPPGKDPDAFSVRLREHHKILWGRTLPSGADFLLDDSLPARKAYLTHSSQLGDYELSSDTVIPSFTRWKRMQPIVSQVDEEENEAFRTIGYTIGGMMLWPRRSDGGLKSINVMRGFNSKIADRMDLTLECVRRHYVGVPHPLEKILDANASFFRLFGDFEGFVSHFFLEDMIDGSSGRVAFFMPFDDFTGPSTPRQLQTYLEYRQNSIDFIQARNERIARWARHES